MPIITADFIQRVVFLTFPTGGITSDPSPINGYRICDHKSIHISHFRLTDNTLLKANDIFACYQKRVGHTKRLRVLAFIT